MERREFLVRMGAVFGAAWTGCERPVSSPERDVAQAEAGDTHLTLFLAGDVMTGRGVDQIFPCSVDPGLHERYIKDAKAYVRLAERANGPIPRDAPYDYVWGDGLDELARRQPAVRIVNLETAVTAGGAPWPGKGIHYRMHPDNVAILAAAGIDVCVLGNNHVLDWGYSGLDETLRVLHAAGLRTAGAGTDRDAAAAPAVVPAPSGRVLVFSYGVNTAGVPSAWAVASKRPGVAWLENVGREHARDVSDHVRRFRRAGDRVVVSMHWGPNWGYQVPAAHRAFAHALIDAAAADVVHGHSSHHPQGIEVYEGRLILHGCGDLLNDYEGIGGHEQYRPELTVMYFPTLDASGALVRLEMAAMRVRRFRLTRASGKDRRWLGETLDRESRKLGARVEVRKSGLTLTQG
ncbi:MAG: CapA family protein [Planctomycetota bacterium]|jgi:poly-gamma-glutamate synthesis protein (capsule biosynthesis protein)